ncbi:hypothetical protein Q5424_06740 [Conexibacter sp. JD483]|uniref:Vgb family protein n=1 Tax=unclassified Conexibacter TaxID=2627773 RepID=UPI002728E1FC|nr:MULTISPECIES: hypothetical protein [unclassified Conexibacter]MDO8185357.1 hypothetical protein [Conexibacter sp. CPCC 205706]MDO8198467.1 hypothetical protein [Conexibacter sp. CPCC 205762]MDR9368768.1 hypothetical protein [Conexibacter sp. JD483]
MRASRLPSTLLATAATTLAVAAAPAVAAPAVDGDFPVSGTPGQLTLGPDGNIWVTLSSGDGDIAKIAPDGRVEEFRDAKLNGAVGIVSGPDGRVWLTEPGRFVSFSPADPVGSATEVPAPQIRFVNRVVVDDAGVLWTASDDNVVSTTTAGVVRSFRVTGLLSARGIAFGGDRRLWIVDFLGASVISVGRDGSDVQTFDVGAGTGPQEIAAGPGTQVAYTDPQNEVGRITPPGPPLRTQLPLSDPFGLTFAIDGAWWIARFAADDLARLTPDGTVTTLGGFPPAAGPRWVTSGANGTLWVSLLNTRRVARVSGVEAPRVDPPRTDPPRTDPPRTDVPRDTAKPTVRLGLSGRAAAGARALVVSGRVSEAATVSATLRQRVAGKRRGGSCVKPTRKLRRARSCLRWVTLASAKASTRGAGSVRLTLRRRGGFAAGRYRVDYSARDTAGNKSATKTIAITLRARRR